MRPGYTRTLLTYLRSHPRASAAVFTLGILSSLAEGVSIGLFIPFLYSIEGAGQGPIGDGWLVRWLWGLFEHVPAGRRLPVILGCILLAVGLRAALAYGHGYTFARLDARIGHELRVGIFRQLLSVSYGYLTRQDSGELLNTLSAETWRTTGALSTFVNLVITLCTAVVYVGLLLLISWELTVLVAGAMLLISLTVRLLTRRARALGGDFRTANEALAGRMMQGLWGMKLIRLFRQEAREEARFEQTSARVRDVMMKQWVVSALVHPVYELLAAVVLVVVLYVSLLDGGPLAPALVFIFVLYRLQPKVKALDSARVHLEASAAGVDAVATLLARDDKPYTASGSAPYAGLQRELRFAGVTFRYAPEERPALAGVSATIPAQKTTALVGPSGAGKSTLINLLFRLYDPQGGTIYADEQPLPDLDLGSWRSRIALVSQDAYLFDVSVRDNIAYGRPEATLSEVQDAARKADAHGFVSRLPAGYETVVGDQGTRLSGGQKQRIALARAILYDPEILILDEATNALDSISEGLIQDALALLRRDRTVIVIAHRLSSIEAADHVVVLNEGQVQEQGSVQDLLGRGGLFASMYNLQHSESLR